jgi:ribosome-binding factor A
MPLGGQDERPVIEALERNKKVLRQEVARRRAGSAPDPRCRRGSAPRRGRAARVRPRAAGAASAYVMPLGGQDERPVIEALERNKKVLRQEVARRVAP